MYIKKTYVLEDTDYSNATVKDSEFYVLNGNNSLYIYNKDKKINTKSLLKNYTVLTYNGEFYLMNLNGAKTFDKINSEYKVIGKFNIKKNSHKKINDIFYDKYDNKYLVAEKLNVYSVDFDGNYLKNEVFATDFYNIKNNGVCKIEYATSPFDFKFTAVGTDGEYKYVAYEKNGSSFLTKISKNGNVIETLFIGDGKHVNSIVFNNGMFLLVNDGKNNLYEIGSQAINPKVSEILDKIIILLDDVSVNEEAIANLINTESQKIKKVLEVSTDVNKILEVNASVKDVVSAATKLDDSQYNNLNIILECIKELQKYLN